MQNSLDDIVVETISATSRANVVNFGEIPAKYAANGPCSNVMFHLMAHPFAIARKPTSALHSTALAGRACCMLQRINLRDVRGTRKMRFESVSE